jgi:F-type H+-transporting ATPase subunit b
MIRQVASRLAAVFLVAAPALAAGSEAEGGPESPIGWVFRWLNFLILASVLGYFIAKKAPAVFRKRAENIGAAISESAAVKAEAERRLRAAEEKLARLDQEVAGLRAAAMRDAEAERERILATAREEAAKIERAAQAEVVAAERAAWMELKAMAAGLAVERAEAAIRLRITPQAEEALFRAFLSNLARPVPAVGGFSSDPTRSAG